jgi:hypothetical protein
MPCGSGLHRAFGPGEGQAVRCQRIVLVRRTVMADMGLTVTAGFRRSAARMPQQKRRS